MFKKTGYWPIGAGFFTKIIAGELTVDSDASEVRVFKKVPDKVVPGQRTFLMKLEENNFQI